MDSEERSLTELFMSFQSPVEIPGVSNIDFLNMAYNAGRRKLGLLELGPIGVLLSSLLIHINYSSLLAGFLSVSNIVMNNIYAVLWVHLSQV